MPPQRSHPTDHLTAEDSLLASRASLPPTVVAQIQILEAAKERAIRGEDYDKAKILKQNIQDLMVSREPLHVWSFFMGASPHEAAIRALHSLMYVCR
jgi:hypothetical protein